jgi:hypothetical protein
VDGGRTTEISGQAASLDGKMNRRTAEPQNRGISNSRSSYRCLLQLTCLPRHDRQVAELLLRFEIRHYSVKPRERVLLFCGSFFRLPSSEAACPEISVVRLPSSVLNSNHLTSTLQNNIIFPFSFYLSNSFSKADYSETYLFM